MMQNNNNTKVGHLEFLTYFGGHQGRRGVTFGSTLGYPTLVLTASNSGSK